MTDISSLQIQVDARQLREATEALNRLSQSAITTEQATSRVGTASTNMNASLHNTANSLRQTETSTRSLSSAFSTLQTVIISLGILNLAKDLLKTVEQVQNMEIRLKGLTKNAQDYAEVQSYLIGVSARHHKNNLV